MFYRLAFSNVKKSLRDYTVYFLTLTFGICIFYVFNSIESQQAMLLISQCQKNIMKSMTQLISYISVFISVILGFLIIYANGFLIKRRKKELGLYMTLGMKKGKISRILIFETFVIGVLSLIVGLVAGVFLSHGFSVITAHLFAAKMKEFTFIFSQSAFIKSIIYFSIIYLVVMVFNTFTISKYKLIDLLNAGKKNEDIKIKKLGVSVFIFLLSLAFLAAAYWCIIDNGLLNIDKQFYAAFVLCFIGTILFFYSLSGFLLRVVQANKNIYFKNLNMFILRQINSKINTNFITMTFICLMLAVTLVALSSGMALSDSLTNELEKLTPYDVSFEEYANEVEEMNSIAAGLKNDGVNIDEIAKDYYEAEVYTSDLFYDVFLHGDVVPTNPYIVESLTESHFGVYKLSDYNALMALQGKPPITLKEDEYALNGTYNEMVPTLEHFLQNNGELTLFGVRLTASSTTLLDTVLGNSQMSMDAGTVIVPDYLLQGQKPSAIILNINYNSKNGTNQLLLDQLDTIYGLNEKRPYSQVLTQQNIYEQSKGLSAVVTYMVIYIGIVFLITSSAVLALQQLSEVSDNVERYALLSKLGTERKMLNNALFTQVLIYFATPLLLAIVHSVVGIYVAGKVVLQFGKINLLANISFAAAIFVLVYGGYFMATYLSSRNILKPQKS